jgi:hypothetical protein
MVIEEKSFSLSPDGSGAVNEVLGNLCLVANIIGVSVYNFMTGSAISPAKWWASNLALSSASGLFAICSSMSRRCFNKRSRQMAIWLRASLSDIFSASRAVCSVKISQRDI